MISVPGLVLPGSHFTVNCPMGHKSALGKQNKGQRHRKELLPILENHCRDPSSLEVERFPMTPGRSDASGVVVYTRGEEVPGYFDTAFVLSFLFSSSDLGAFDW